MTKLEQVVLCVDDSKVILLSNKKNLEEYGFKVEMAKGATEALEFLKSNRPDCILLDYEMPKMSGPELCQILKCDSDYKNIPIIMLTGKNTKEYLLKGINAGADDFIGKSTDVEILVSKIHAILRLGDLLKKQLELERFRTAHAMVTTYNHEIRNPLAIATGMLGKSCEALTPEKHEKVKDSLLRIGEIIKKIDYLTSTGISFDSYIGETEMVKLEKS